MGWTYSGDPNDSDLDATRFWCQDTDSARKLLSDEEINYLVDRGAAVWGDPIAYAALACDIIAGKLSSARDISADGVSISGGTQLADKYRALAQELRETYDRILGVGAQPIVFGVDTLEPPDLSVTAPSFGKGFTDNPRAGTQEYGLREAYRTPYEVPDSGFWTGP